MLLSFQISGFYSFGEKLQKISFCAKPRSKVLDTKYEDNFILLDKHRPMKSVLFFGSNATGKTNLFEGIKALIEILRMGLHNFLQSKDTNIIFNKNCNEIKLGMEIGDEKNEIFTYFICFNKGGFLLEEKFKINNKILFQFNANEKPKLKFDKLEFLNDDIGYSHYLSKFISYNVGLTDSVMFMMKDYIKKRKVLLKLIDNIEIKTTQSFPKHYRMDFGKDKKDFFEKEKTRIISILQIIDPSIEDFYFKQKLTIMESFDFEETQGSDTYQIFFKRNENTFNLTQESEGIKKIMQLMKDLCELEINGKTLIVDELDSSISTRCLIRLFNEFINTSSNHNGQILVSSHNPLLFNISFLNSQQIFIVIKDENLETKINHYYDYDKRSKNEIAYLDYLKGSFDVK